MTQVSKRLPVLLALLVGLAMAFMAWGLVPNTVFAENEGSVDTICFGGDYEYNWAHFYYIDSQSVVLNDEELAITVLDEDKSPIAAEKYDLVIEHTWYDDEQNQDQFETVKPPLGLAETDKTETGGFTEYVVTATAKEGSGYEGEAKGTFVVADKYSLNYYCSEIEFPSAPKKTGWAMHDWYWFREGQTIEPTVTAQSGNGDELTFGGNYSVLYHRAKESIDSLTPMDELFDDNGTSTPPVSSGDYFAVIQGINPYYGGSIIPIRIKDPGTVYFTSEKDYDLWSDQDKAYHVNIPEGIEGELTIEVGFWNPDKEKWGADQPFDAAAGYYEYNSETSVLTLHGNKIIQEYGAPDFPLTLYATIKNSSDETIASGHEDVWLQEAEYRYDLPDEHLNLLPGWEFQIDKTIHAFVRNAEHPEGKEFDLTAKNFGVYGPIGLLNYTDAGDHRNYKAMKIGDARVHFDYDDYFGVTQTANIYVTVSDTVYNVDVWSENGVYKGLPGSSLTLRANARKETMTDNGETSPVDWEYNSSSDGLRYEWELVSNEFATIVPDGDTAVLKFKDMPADRDQIHEGVQVKVSVYEENKEEPVIVRDDNWFQVVSEFDQIYPTQIDSGLDVEKSITIKPEVRHFELGQSGYSVVDNKFDVAYDLNSYDGNAISVNEENGGFTVERKGNWDTNFRIEARWDDGRGWTDQWYHFDDKNYRPNFGFGHLDVYDDHEVTLEPWIEDDEGLGPDDYEIKYTVGTWKDNDWDEVFNIDETDFLKREGNQLTIYGDKMDAAHVHNFRVVAQVKIGDMEFEDTDCWIDLRESCKAWGHDHTWLKGILKQPTLDEVGYEVWICPDYMFLGGCGETRLREIPQLIDINDATVKVKNPTYTGKALKPALTVTYGGKTLKAGTDYTATYTNNTKVGTATVTLKGIGTAEVTPEGQDYPDLFGGTKKATFKIVKAKNPMVVKTKAVTFKAKDVKKKNQTIKQAAAFTVTKNQGKVTYKKKSGDAKITIASNGTITVKKGLKKGKYKFVVNVTAAGNANYNKITKAATVNITVK